jgi:hypothetical protein
MKTGAGAPDHNRVSPFGMAHTVFPDRDHFTCGEAVADFARDWAANPVPGVHDSSTGQPDQVTPRV